MLVASTRTPTFIARPILFLFSHRNRKRHFFNIRDGPAPNIPVVYPKQYPLSLVDAAPLVPRGRPARFLTPKDEVP
jgi:hypothetical protein